MPPRESSIVGPTGEAVLAAAEAELGDHLRSAVVYDAEGYDIRYVADWVREELGEEEFRETTERLHGYVHLDFIERDLFGDLTPVSGKVRTNITRLEHVTLVRYLVGDAGVFLSIVPDADLTALCAAMDDAVASTDDEDPTDG